MQQPSDTIATLMSTAGLGGRQPHELSGLSFKMSGIRMMGGDSCHVVSYGLITSVELRTTDGRTSLKLYVSVPQFIIYRIYALSFSMATKWRLLIHAEEGADEVKVAFELLT